MIPGRRNLRWRLLVAWSLMLGIPAGLQAQVIIQQGNVQIRAQGVQFGLARPDGTAADDQPSPGNLFPVPDRQQLRRLAQAKVLIDQGRFSDAVRVLGTILETSEDYFFQPDKEAAPGVYRSLKQEVLRLLGSLPPEGRRVYELLYGAQARQLLEQALRSGQRELVAEVSRRFFHTQAGYEATLLLGLDYLDRGSPLAGALTLERLKHAPEAAKRFEPTLSLALAVCWQRARMPDKAGEVLSTLIADRRPIQLGGKPLPAWRDSAEAVEWLQRQMGSARWQSRGVAGDGWLLFGGNPARNAAARGGMPLLSALWRVPVSPNVSLVHEDPQPTDLLVGLSRMYAQRGMPLVPSAYPLVVHGRFDQPLGGGRTWHVEDVVLMRTTHKLLAVDLASGKRIWEVPVAEHLAELAELLEQGSRKTLENSQVLLLALGERLWYDTTYGTLSSDGRNVYAIEDLGLPFQTRTARMVIIGGRRVIKGDLRRPYNRLAAIDIATGKLRWALGGPADQFLQWPLAETYFLGPPLPLMGQLFVLAERSGEGTIELLALEADSQNDPGAQGRLLWSQPLVRVDTGVLEDPFRARAGLSPSYADGVLVCPTASGAVVAVDLATRSLLWAYSYPRQAGPNIRAHVIIGPFGPQVTRNTWPGAWQDSAAVVAEGCVLLTPVDSDALHAVSLADGEPLWKPIPRDGDLYLACVYQGKAILVGTNRLRAFHLHETDSEGNAVPAWDGREIALPQGATPTGRGFLSGRHYYLPLSTAEVAVVDVEAGKIVERIKSRRGTVPGNLICHRGKILSQTALGVELFYELEAARAEAERLLAADPDDPAGLRLMGEILLEQGRREEAIACLRRAVAAQSDPRARALLREALLEGLQAEFARYEPCAAEIESLLDDQTQHAEFLRLMAEGLRSTGRPLEAFHRYLALAELDEEQPEMVELGPQHAVRRDRWVRQRLGSLWEETQEAALRSQIEQAAGQRLQVALQSGSLDSLRRFERYFGELPAGDAAREELVRRLAEAGRWLEAEMVLWPDFVSSDPSRAGRATLALAELMRRAGRPEDAAVCYLRLRDELAEVDCGQGKTGAEWFAALAADDPVGRFCQQAHTWPGGEVEVSEENVSSNSDPTFARFLVARAHSLGPFFQRARVELDQNRRVLTARNELGQARWQLSLTEISQQTRFVLNRNFTRASGCGHLLVLLAGSRLVAVDTLGAGQSGPRLAWHQDIQQDAEQALAVVGGPVIMANGVVVLGAARSTTTRPAMNVLGAVTSRTICFQRFTDLVGVDPLSGRVVWVRQNVPAACELFGDEHRLFVLPPDEEEALVLRPSDGTLLGRRRVPRFSNGQAQVAINGAAVVRPARFAPLSTTCLATLGSRLLLWRPEDDGARVLELYDVWGQKAVWPARRFDGGSVIDVAEDRWVGICEPDGHFVLVDAQSGSAVVDTRLRAGAARQALPRLEGLSLMRCDEGFLVVTHHPRTQTDPPQQIIQPIAGMAVRPVNLGWVFAFDPQGQPLWPRPVQVNDQHLPLEQPPGLPVLVFASQVYNRQPANPASRYQVSLLCLDKRTGRVVFEKQYANTSHTFEAIGNTEEHSVTLRLQRNRVKLTFTDRPITEPAEPEAESTEEGKLLPALGRVLGRLGEALRQTEETGPLKLAPSPVLPALGPDKPVSPFDELPLVPLEPPKR